MKKFFILLWGIFYAFSANAKLTASIEYPTVSEGQVVEFRMSSDAPKKGLPDLSVLKTDFDVLAQSSGSSYQNINGQTTASYDFVLNILPKKTGVLTIPSILWDNEKTDPIKISIAAAGQSQKTENAEIITMTGRVLEKQVYENAALTYRAVVLSQVSFVDAAFIAPIMENAEVIPLGSIQLGQTEKDGKIFQTLTQDYAIFPAKSGTNQTITGAAFQGLILKKRNRPNNFIDPFGFNDTLIYAPVASNRKEILLRAENEKVDILARPIAWGAKWWLPAKKVVAEQTFSSDLNAIKAGDSITRTIEIRAEGALGTQLPDITFNASNDFKVYAETAQKNSGYEKNLGLVGVLKQSFVFVPLHSGKVSLPSMTLYWFDTVENIQKQVILPAQEINVLPSEKEVSKEISNQQPIKVQEKTNAEPVLVFQNPYEKENNLLFFAAGLCVGLILFLIAFAIMRHKHKKKLPDLYPGA